MRFIRLFLIATSVLTIASQVIGQDAPLTRLEPIRYDSTFIGGTDETQTGFIRDAIRRLWRLDDPAPYHKAGVKVSCPTGYAGSGALIANDKGYCVAVTNHHVIEGSRTAVVLTLDGRRIECNVVYADPARDVAVLVNQNAKIEGGVPIYDRAVPLGEEIVLLGFGGPGRMVPAEDFRPCIGRNQGPQYSSPVTIDCYTCSGDSGAGLIYRKHGAIVGVNWGHYGHPTHSVDGNWVAGSPASSKIDGPGLVETLTQVCQPYCRPIIRGPQQVILEPQPQQPVQPQAAPCECDTEAITQAVIDAIRQDESMRGPAGPQGPPGADGASITPEQIGAVAATIAEQLRNDPNLRGPAGPQGEQGASGRDGRDGTDAIISPEQLRQAIADYFSANPQTVSLALMDEYGNEIDRDTVEIGGTLRLQFSEVSNGSR